MTCAYQTGCRTYEPVDIDPEMCLYESECMLETYREQRRLRRTAHRRTAVAASELEDVVEDIENETRLMRDG